MRHSRGPPARARSPIMQYVTSKCRMSIREMDRRIINTSLIPSSTSRRRGVAASRRRTIEWRRYASLLPKDTPIYLRTGY